MSSFRRQVCSLSFVPPITNLCCLRASLSAAGYRGRGFSAGQGDKKLILRLASDAERAALMDKVRDEEKALEVVVRGVFLLLLMLRNFLDAQATALLQPTTTVITITILLLAGHPTKGGGETASHGKSVLLMETIS